MADKVVKPEQGVRIQNLQVRTVNWSRKDVGKLARAIKSATSVEYPDRGPLLDIYEVISLDPHLSGLVEKRIAAIQNKSASFERDSKKDDSFDTFIGSSVYREIIRQWMLKIFWGLDGQEFLPGKEVAIYKIPRKHIKPEYGIVSINESGNDGIDYTGLTSVMILGEVGDLGLFAKCAAPALYKKDAMADWSRYLENFGSPWVIGRYSADDIQTKQELDRAIEAAGNSTRMSIPREAEIELKDGKASNGDGKLQQLFIDSINKELSVIILGNTDTTTASAGSGYAQSKVMSQQQMEIHRSDLAYIGNLLNSEQFLGILRSYGFNTDGGRFVFDKEFDPAMLKESSEVDKWVASQVPVSDEYIYTKYGVDKPDNYDELKAQMEERRNAAIHQPEEVEETDPPTKGKRQKPKGGKPPKNAKKEKLSFREKLANFFG